MRKLFTTLLVAVMLCTLLLPCATAETEDGWKNILILGGDARNTTDYNHTDAILILSINTQTNEGKLTSIAPYTLTTIPGQNGEDSINNAIIVGGPELTLETVNNAFDAGISDYMIVNYTDLANIIDLFGGIDINVDEAEKAGINEFANLYVSQIAPYDGTQQLDTTGTVHVNGLLGVAYCYGFDMHSSAFACMLREQEVMTAMLKQAQNMNVDDLMAITDKIFANLSTTLSNDEMQALGQVILGIDPAGVSTYTLPVDGTYTTQTIDEYVCLRPDFQQNAALLHQFIYGE